MKAKYENLLDEFVEDLDFDKLLIWLGLMDIDNEPPPIDDMYPDWEAEKKSELMGSLCDLFDLPIGIIQRSRDDLLAALKNLLEVDLLKDEHHIAGRQAIVEAEKT